MLVKRHKFPVIRITSSGGGIHSTVIIAKNSVLYTWRLLRKLISNVLTTKRNGNYVTGWRCQLTPWG